MRPIETVVEPRSFSMTAETQAILKAVLALPETERMLLTDELLEAISPDVRPLTEEEFAAELDRRAAEIERDPSMGIPLSDVLQED
jgi:putative addiction module component (TIGR02574 family)